MRNTDPNLHPHARSGEALKAQWTKLKGSFSVVYNRFSASGKSNPDNFMQFTNGDAKLYYMFLAFRESPSLEAILRTRRSETKVRVRVPIKPAFDALVSNVTPLVPAGPKELVVNFGSRQRCGTLLVGPVLTLLSATAFTGPPSRR